MSKRPALNKEIIKLLENSKLKWGEAKWFKKHKFYPVFEDWLPETVGRTLRDLESENILEVSYYKGKYTTKLARYKLRE